MAVAFEACACRGVLGFCKLTGSVFLDKTCISQSNKYLKAQSIRNLSLILHRSRNMLLMCDETYFTHMWRCSSSLRG